MNNHHNLLCALTNHPYNFNFCVRDGDLTCHPEATVADLLHEVEVDHQWICGCNAKIGRRVWTTLIPLEDAAAQIAGFIPTAQSLNLDDRLERFAVPMTSHIHLMVEASEATEPRETTLANAPKHISVKYGHAHVFHYLGRHPKVEARLQSPSSDPDFYYMSSFPGVLIVDKFRFVRPLFASRGVRRLPVLHRPAGSGKTTFLTMVAAYFDLVSDWDHSDFPLQPDAASTLDGFKDLLVLFLDLAELRLSVEMSVKQLFDVCDSFMDEAASRFYSTYRSVFTTTANRVLEDNRSHSLTDIMYMARDRRANIFIAIDNYSTPQLEYSDARIAHAVSEVVMSPILRHFRHGRIWSGLLVGDDLAGSHHPWANVPFFRDSTIDMSSSIELRDAVGFTTDEVTALSSLTCADLPQHVAELPRMPHNRDSPLYRARDVLSLCQELLAGFHVCQPPPVAQFLDAPPVQSPDLPLRTHDDDLSEPASASPRSEGSSEPSPDAAAWERFLETIRENLRQPADWMHDDEVE